MTPTVVLLGAVAAMAMGTGGPKADDYVARMAKEHSTDTPVATAEATVEPKVPVKGESVTYATVDGKPVEGYLARPEQAKKGLPGIIVIHEWWGLNDNIRAMTRRLAGEGYTALAVDLYGGQVAATPEAARKLMQAAMAGTAAADSNLEQAYSFLKEKEDAKRVGVVGWCFGGTWSLKAALLMPTKLDAAVVYYGQPVTDVARLKTLKMPVLGFFGSEDQGIPVATVREFEKAMKEAGRKASVLIYTGAHHAFANPSGTHYDPEAAADAWRRTVEFFNLHLK